MSAFGARTVSDKTPHKAELCKQMTSVFLKRLRFRRPHSSPGRGAPAPSTGPDTWTVLGKSF